MDLPKVRLLLAGERAQLRFRAKFADGLRKAFRRGKLVFSGFIAQLANPKRFAAFVNSLFKQQWVVYTKPAFGAPTQVLRYLGRYTHRRRHQQSRLLAFNGEHVTCRWKDYARGNKQRKMPSGATNIEVLPDASWDPASILRTSGSDDRALGGGVRRHAKALGWQGVPAYCDTPNPST